LLIMGGVVAVHGQSAGFSENIDPVRKLKPTDSVFKLKVCRVLVRLCRCGFLQLYCMNNSLKVMK